MSVTVLHLSSLALVTVPPVYETYTHRLFVGPSHHSVMLSTPALSSSNRSNLLRHLILLPIQRVRFFHNHRGFSVDGPDDPINVQRSDGSSSGPGLAIVDSGPKRASGTSRSSRARHPKYWDV